MIRFFGRGRAVWPSLWRDNRGLTTVEYAVISALVSVGLVAAVAAVGSAVNAEWTRTETTLNAPPGTYSGTDGTNTGGTGNGNGNGNGGGNGKPK